MSSYSFNELYNFNIKSVYDIDQDKSGNFWFGTDRGLVQFDGKNFKTYFYPKFDKEYTNIKFGADGSVYFINFGGQLFRLKNDSIEIMIEYVLEESLIKDYFIMDNDIYYYVSGGGRLYRHNSSTKVEEVVLNIPGRGIIESVIKEGDKLIAFKSFVKNNESRLCTISKIEIDFSSADNHKKEELIEFPQKSSINRIVKYGKEMIFLHFHSKLQIYSLVKTDDQVHTFTDVKSTTINNVGIIKNNVYILGKTQVKELNLLTMECKLWMDNVNASCVFVDNEENTWVGTLDNGIRIVPSTKVNQIDLVPFNIGKSNIDMDNNIYFSDARGNLYKTSGSYETSTRIETIVLPKQGIAINDYLNQIHFASHDKLFDSDKGKLFDKNGNDYFKYLFFLDNENYIRTGGGQTYLFGDIKSLPFRFPELIKKEIVPGTGTYRLKSGRSEQVYVDKYRNFMYLDFIDGLILFSRDKDPISLYLNGEPILVSTMKSDGDRGMYIASNNNELIYFKDGVYQNHIELSEQIDVICLAKEFIFLKGNKGIYRYNKHTEETDLINFIDGVNTEDVLDIYFHSDTIYAIGGKGICKFPYDYGGVNEVAPYLTLNQVELFDKPVASGKTIFNYDENQITFKFQAVGIRSQKTLTYEYQLNEQDWQQTSWNVPFVRYAQLAPGEYEFKLKACNEDGVCSEEKVYRFQIKQHFSSTWWFILMIVVVALLILFVIIALRQKRINKENSLMNRQEELKREVYKSKITAIRSQMNPHFMFNALNTIQDYIISNEKLIASEFLADFADLMRLYLNQSKQDFITIDEEVRTIELYLKLEKSRFGDDFVYEIDVDPNVDVGNVEIPIMLLQPLIENAIKHGLLHKKGTKHLYISIGFEKNRLKLEVRDNGIGFKSSMQMKAQNTAHESFATNAMQEKITLLRLHYQIEIDFQVNHLKNEADESIGTSVIMKI